MTFLGPQDRTLLLESLRPLEDYSLDIAIGTTYTLDLIAMMVAPVGFTFFEVDPNDPGFLQDPLEILEAIRRHSSQMVLFHEAGRIAKPSRYRPLLTYLEDRIVAVTAPTPRRAFHPKIWLIRYVNPAGHIRYRLLCLSRNLTFDRSWDTILILDGQLRTDRSAGFGCNKELREFVGALPKMAVVPLSPGIRSQVMRAEREIARVEWSSEDLPWELKRFWPLGHDRVKRWPFKGNLQRVAIVSPFVGARTLTRLAETGSDHVLISRQECLDKISPSVLSQFESCYQMADEIQGVELEDQEDVTPSQPSLRGLHAKLYLAEDGWEGRIWTGSANATSNAFDGNVEFLVELCGKKSAIGVDAFLQKVKGSANFLDLLQPYASPDGEIGDAELEALQQELDELRMPMATAGWAINVSVDENSERWVPIASTRGKLPTWPTHLSVSCRLASAGDGSGMRLESGAVASSVFEGIALESLTSFLAIRIEGRNNKSQAKIEFLVNATLIGAPANRKERLLRHMLQDKDSVLRFLLLLLADRSDVVPSGQVIAGRGWNGVGSTISESHALLEPLLRALDRSPERLATIATLLQDLEGTVEGKALIPDGLVELFAAVWASKDGTAK